MSPLFWMALTWVLITIVVARLPVHQRFVPGALLLFAAMPILISICLQVGWFMGFLSLVAIASLFPYPLRVVQALYRGEQVQVNAGVLRYLVVPSEK
jgi:hypothetical protein